MSDYPLYFQFLFWFCSVFAALYIALIVTLSYGWFIQRKNMVDKTVSGDTKISVIVPVRNEEINIVQCLNDIINQTYPKTLTEIIIIDDCSTDSTLQKVQNLIEKNSNVNLKLIKLDGTQGSQGKKLAVSHAVNFSSGELVITTDADCRMNNEWIFTIVAHYEKEQSSMIIAPVCFTKENSIFKKFQSLEFLSLVASTGGSTQLGFPIMCNAANLAFQKKDFVGAEENANGKDFSSGDDVFLMMNFKRNNKKITFLKSNNAVVFTEAKSSIGEFISQRRRWVSKAKGYQSSYVVLIAFIVFSFNFGLFLYLCSAPFNHYFAYISIVFLGIKIVIDLPIMIGITQFFNKQSLLILYLPLQLINCFYVPFITISGLFGKYEWKGRRVK